MFDSSPIFALSNLLIFMLRLNIIVFLVLTNSVPIVKTNYLLLSWKILNFIIIIIISNQYRHIIDNGFNNIVQI